MDRDIESTPPSDTVRVFVDPDRVLLRASLSSSSGEILACAHIRRLLLAEGVHSEHHIEQGGGASSESLVVLFGSGGILSVLAHALHKFLDLRANKTIEIETSDGVTVMTKGASIDEFERVLRSAREPAPTDSPGESPGEESQTD